ncbi:MAG: DUF4835 family protein [Chitinophagaceae bacterium]|nr:DUF4835 family protein [Chitinophagaceae bacterium]
MRSSLLLFCFCIIALNTTAQELNARVRVIDNQIPTTVDRKMFRTLEASLTSFLNNRRWSADNFKQNEKINCQFLINLESMPEQNIFSASITIQAARPVYSTSYVSPIINFKDPNLDFKYIESQPMEFNENRVSGSDPLVSNLTAVMAYYAYLIVGFDYASFSLKGGNPYFQKALNIVNNAPDGSKISGWKSFENNNRNRYWLTENLINNRYTIIHDVYYNYYRKGLDYLYENETGARTEVTNALVYLDNLNRETPNLMIVQFFMLGKADELINLFKKAPPQEKTKMVEILSRLDVTNSNKYKQEIR